MESIIQKRSQVTFPQHTGERVYMREFFKRNGLPVDLERWQPTVDAMLDGVDTDGPIYLMIDQGFVRARNLHRRPGIHIDGYWVPSIQSHRGGGHRGGHISASGEWDNDGPKWITDSSATYWPPEALILASDVRACRAFAGEWDGVPNEGGDCTHIDTSGMQEIILDAGFTYAGNVTMLHESLPVPVDCLRTLVRLNVPGWSPNQ